MKKITAVIIIGLLAYCISYSQDEIFTGMENTVGYIKDEKGNKYIVIETPEGAKLIKTEKDPENILKSSLGISKEDLNITGE
jgi:hypothetical protein